MPRISSSPHASPEPSAIGFLSPDTLSLSDDGGSWGVGPLQCGIESVAPARRPGRLRSERLSPASTPNPRPVPARRAADIEAGSIDGAGGRCVPSRLLLDLHLYRLCARLKFLSGGLHRILGILFLVHCVRLRTLPPHSPTASGLTLKGAAPNRVPPLQKSDAAEGYVCSQQLGHANMLRLN